jgi:hypothetical protein
VIYTPILYVCNFTPSLWSNCSDTKSIFIADSRICLAVTKLLLYFGTGGDDALGLSLSCFRTDLMNCSSFVISTLERWSSDARSCILLCLVYMQLTFNLYSLCRLSMPSVQASYCAHGVQCDWTCKHIVTLGLSTYKQNKTILASLRTPEFTVDSLHNS